MTFAEMLEVGRECLAEYEPRLKVLGHRPWDSSAKEKSIYLTASPSSLTRQQSIEIFSTILDTLEAMQEGFTTSGPEFTVEREDEYQSVSYNELSLSIASKFDIYKSENEMRITVWYFPSS